MDEKKSSKYGSLAITQNILAKSQLNLNEVDYGLVDNDLYFLTKV